MRKKAGSRGNLTLVGPPALRQHPNPLRTIDLFSGAGGITEGFRQAGYECLYGNDQMPEAMDTFQLNHPEAWPDCRNIERVEPSEIRAKLNLRKGELDVLVGGPPCQGFSINAPDRFISDPRNKLFKDYVRFLEEFEPKAFLFENVPGLLSLGDGKVLDRIVSEFVRLDYHVSVKILFAAHYGIPQERWRLIVLGSRFGEIAPPEPTHYAKGRANFRSAGLTFQLTESDQAKLKPVVTVGEAIADLPRLEMGEGAETIGYTGRPVSEYSQRMRNPTGVTYNHYAAKLSKQNAERMKYVAPGGSWRDIPHHLLPKGMQRARKSDHTKRYGRLRNDGLAGTVLTKCDPHWGTVFLPDQNRSLTVREAARFQSFPDAYEFKGSRVSQYEQIGNAVPVLMAKAIAESIRAHLEAHGCIKSELPDVVNG
ncbi:DNA cytosine methyltransferase [Granulicella pectinivorans]|jgi:DNA (cytosine-5)-methyltransferase 1|uniref:DNA cytosine methyltransferase n=1 Tax=Granulicella pectinivorans TaxID=474950 RepID=UPI000B7DE6ED|nr:DNA cytosine methyltransferase [Granulicella pectinivorans]